MKDFLKFTLATVTGIILSSIVLFIIGMVTLFGIVSTADTETIVKKNSADDARPGTVYQSNALRRVR